MKYRVLYIQAGLDVSSGFTRKGGDIMHYNFHNEKYQTSDVVGIHREQYREISDTGKYRNDIRHEDSHLNVYEELSPEGSNWYKRISKAKESTAQQTGKNVRKDAVVLCSTVESVPQSWPREVSTEYFRQKAKWYQETAGRGQQTERKCSILEAKPITHVFRQYRFLFDIAV